MKITAFILSILLSTTALAENRADQYSDVNMEEIVEQAISEDQIRLVKVDDAPELVNSAFDRGEISETERNDILSRIYESKATHQNNGVEYSDGCLRIKKRSAIFHLFYMAGAIVGWIIAPAGWTAGALLTLYALTSGAGAAGAGLGGIVAELVGPDIAEEYFVEVCSD